MNLFLNQDNSYYHLYSIIYSDLFLIIDKNQGNKSVKISFKFPSNPNYRSRAKGGGGKSNEKKTIAHGTNGIWLGE